MKTSMAKQSAALVLACLLCAGAIPASDGGASVVNTSFRARSSPEQLSLEDLERMALANNPTLAQAEALVRAAAGRKLQAGLYPNPIIGATGDENSPGPVIRGGEFGFFVEQTFVTAGKLRLSKAVYELEEAQAVSEAEKQKLKVLNSVRLLYYQALGAESLVSLQTELLRIGAEAVTVSRQLFNLGQADQPDLLQAEIEKENAELNLIAAKNELEETWKHLAASVGNPALQLIPLAGDLEKTLPDLDPEAVLATLLRDSPEVRRAQDGVSRAEFAAQRARVDKIPDIVVRGGLRYNRELLEPPLIAPVGLEGFFDIGVRIPLFDRNQGNLAAARAEQDRAGREVERVKLALRSRLAAVLREYQDARSMAEKYRDEMIPRAQKSYDLYFRSFQQMAAAYPQVLIAQRSLFRLRVEYIRSLVRSWQAVVSVRGFLLTNGLEPPSGSIERMEASAGAEN